jgi:6,7-dimethyl-8-ribityllumazine synthase
MGKGIAEIKGLAECPVRQTMGSADASGLRFAVAVSRFNDELTHQLANSAVTCLLRSGAAEAQVELFWVPGAYELPALLERLAASEQYDALIALGVVVEGETPHAQMINDSTGAELLRIAARHGVPVINEIVGVRNWEQAVARCAGLEGTRGWYAAEAAVEMATLFKAVESRNRKVKS